MHAPPAIISNLWTVTTSSHFKSDARAMRISGLLPLIFVNLANAKTFKVFHNTFDPAVFGTTGGAHHNATGEGNVDALSICIRFQVMLASMFQSNNAWKTFFLISCSLQTWPEMMLNGSGGARLLEYGTWKQAESCLRLQLECTSASLFLGTLWLRLLSLATFWMIMGTTVFISRGNGTIYAFLGHQVDQQKLFW